MASVRFGFGSFCSFVSVFQFDVFAKLHIYLIFITEITFATLAIALLENGSRRSSVCLSVRPSVRLSEANRLPNYKCSGVELGIL